MGGKCGTMMEKVSMEKPEGNRPLERPRRGLQNNIKMDIKEI
jgi:hypothetical protein